ncbi:hypothetical protein EQ804_11250 [Staphylococcus hominis]|nr:hypothetical protein EQ804_11250 [Staphylococcus hominis]
MKKRIEIITLIIILIILVTLFVIFLMKVYKTNHKDTEYKVKSRLLCKMLYNVFTISTYQN